MPIYEYHCGNCGADLEIFQHMTDPTLTLCPQCKAEALAKVFSPVGIVFRGSGFYATDNKSSKSALSPGPARGDEAKAGATSSADTAKPESAAPSSPADTSGDKSTPAAKSGDS